MEDHAPSKSHSGSSYVSTNTSVKSEMAIINHNNNNNNNGVGQKTLVDHQVTTITTTTAKLASKPQSQVEVNLAQVDVDRTERASEASGAILALTLGLSITGLLLVLVGCRLRMVHRRLRRGRSPFAHDADYLVNGMYL